MPGLSNLGPGGARHLQHQPPSSPLPQPPSEQQAAATPSASSSASRPLLPTMVPRAATAALARASSNDTMWVVRSAQKLAGWAIGLGTAAYLLFYQWVIEPAAPG